MIGWTWPSPRSFPRWLILWSFPCCSQDTLRDCDQESTCYNTVISPIYFVSFVLTAQFVLVNVVIAVLMKHLEESNKEAKEEAELEAELEMEMKTISPSQHSPSDIFAWTGTTSGERPESPRGFTNPLQVKVDSQLSLAYHMVRISVGGWRGLDLHFCWGKTCMSWNERGVCQMFWACIPCCLLLTLAWFGSQCCREETPGRSPDHLDASVRRERVVQFTLEVSSSHRVQS